MAARSFLLKDDLPEALQRLMAGGAHFPKGAARIRPAFSLWLEERLLARLNAIGDFAELIPIRLGSWSRHELTPKSDIDLLFAGPEERVNAYMAEALRQGLKLRARTPEDPSDWTVGVEPFDILALLSAEALDARGAWELEAQIAKANKHKRAIFRAIVKERDERRRRQDSITNYLEPNLKYGAGGLRDIEQALALKSLFARELEGADPYAFRVLGEIKEEFLFLRCYLHVLSSGDILSSQDQLELTERFKMESTRELMTFVQSELERASFYADWVVARCAARPVSNTRVRKFADLNDVLMKLKQDPSQLNQFEARRGVNDWFRRLNGLEVGRALHKALAGPALDDEYLVSLHRTRLLEGFIPDLKKIRGLVQHDHYHRFTADAHLVQALREVQRAQNRPKALGKLAELAHGLTAVDWWTLKLTALFHDLAKGRKGDHSSEGAKLVSKYLTEWGYSESLKQDVQWLVQNHLILSTAAFRQNPQSQATWKRLFECGVEGRRLILLALFTAIDIRATNPEAWNDWKAQLLANLVANMRSTQARRLQAHLKAARASKSNARLEAWLLQLDLGLLEMLSPRLLLADLEAAATATEDLPVRVVKGQSGRVWVRFHRRRDEAGVLLAFVKRLFGYGLSIQMSSVHTLEGIGVYDWFCLRTEKPPRQIGKWLSLSSKSEVKVPHVVFQSIDLMSEDDGEWIFSFRGRDQRGLLLNAAQALHDEELSINWARAHTWGQQVDDVFSVRPAGDGRERLLRLRERLVRKAPETDLREGKTQQTNS